MAIQKKASVSENYCKKLLEDNTDIPDACKRFASIKAKLDAKGADPYAGMTTGAAQSVVRNAQIKRRMSTRHKPSKKERNLSGGSSVEHILYSSGINRLGSKIDRGGGFIRVERRKFMVGSSAYVTQSLGRSG
eukprot:CAMPEP_0197262468 /NCGR_PEP_ID=MMETSP1432-20130617/512_1 /TAXON_ID=44447 /ORGANISM="Pseudo-nitzschia delicatissima, Strain UNC1205" /LENGTH=132 /DNA_ID=CAMNT_0042726769 /DNA_START=104 /DNA_END=503 /DNA_ORIENTATION=+